VIQAEVEGYLAALRVAIHLGISHIVLESDSTNLVMALKSYDYDMPMGGWLFQESRFSTAL
jgi:ribonuclease HI